MSPIPLVTIIYEPNLVCHKARLGADSEFVEIACRGLIMTDNPNGLETTREEWLAARSELLVAEKAHTRARAELAAKRRKLPRVRLQKSYRLTGGQGDENLAEIFHEHSQLLVYHLMFGPDWERPCIGCTAWANAFNGTTEQFAAADARLIAVSRAPYSKLVATAEAFGWRFPWYSALDGDFNYDFYASSHDESPLSRRVIGREGSDGEVVEFDRGENHGVSVFQKDEAGSVFHTYSTYNRGIEALNGALGYADLLPKGRAW